LPEGEASLSSGRFVGLLHSPLPEGTRKVALASLSNRLVPEDDLKPASCDVEEEIQHISPSTIFTKITMMIIHDDAGAVSDHDHAS
jgi:hypothetical protein